jgi:hypothetical protein
VTAGRRSGTADRSRALPFTVALRDWFPLPHEDAAMERSPERSSGTGKPTQKSANEAREGVVGHNVRYVLLFGLAGAIVAFAVVYGYFFAH